MENSTKFIEEILPIKYDNLAYLAFLPCILIGPSFYLCLKAVREINLEKKKLRAAAAALSIHKCKISLCHKNSARTEVSCKEICDV